jgi:hypothetical protein
VAKTVRPDILHEELGIGLRRLLQCQLHIAICLLPQALIKERRGRVLGCDDQQL